MKLASIELSQYQYYVEFCGCWEGKFAYGNVANIFNWCAAIARTLIESEKDFPKGCQIQVTPSFEFWIK